MQHRSYSIFQAFSSLMSHGEAKPTSALFSTPPDTSINGLLQGELSIKLILSLKRKSINKIDGISLKSILIINISFSLKVLRVPHFRVRKPHSQGTRRKTRAWFSRNSGGNRDPEKSQIQQAKQIVSGIRKCRPQQPG